MPAPPDCPSIAATWLQTFSACIASGSAETTTTTAADKTTTQAALAHNTTTQCFHPHAYLHDILVFTWTNRTLGGKGGRAFDTVLDAPGASGGGGVYVRDEGGAWEGRLAEEGVYGGHTIPREDHERARRERIERDPYSNVPPLV
ncbi:hypothetical protein C8F01DRAFT_1093727 [Mycena amicta]|nr:hypothetical protein C8F01DRAFT_1093727 [Mycena amicta]